MIKLHGKHAALAAGMAASLAFGATTAHAQSSDALIDKLVEKGILNVKEANELRAETDQNFTSAYAVKTGMADWVTALRWNGDFRGRYDGIYQDSANYGPVGAPAPNAYTVKARDRFRYRVRFGLTASLLDNFEIGLRLGSGEIGSAAPSLGGSPFSANTTMNNDASRKFIFVDLAYAKWTPERWFEASIGKMNNAFWMTDMVFDPDYNPEGAQEKFTYELNDKNKFSFTSGQWVIAENFSATGSGNNNDAYVFVNQVDWSAKWTPKISSRVAVGIYSFMNQHDITSGSATSLDGNPNVTPSFINQNGTPASGPGSQNFNPIIARGELTYALESFPFTTGEFPLTVGVEYANNPAAGTDTTPGNVPKYSGRGNEAYNLGFQLGSTKLKGNWQIAYSYKYIGSAAVWHGLNDDDFGFNGRGGTDVKGHQVKVAYHAYDAVTLGLSYFNTQEISHGTGTQARQQRLFLDVLLTF
ncbi:MAG: hypothetical protein JWR19_3473 [Pedosphaera sp.]|nr:hypothetical protein [Pedosphaera sp.]